MFTLQVFYSEPLSKKDVTYFRIRTSDLAPKPTGLGFGRPWVWAPMGLGMGLWGPRWVSVWANGGPDGFRFGLRFLPPPRLFSR